MIKPPLDIDLIKPCIFSLVYSFESWSFGQLSHYPISPLENVSVANVRASEVPVSQSRSVVQDDGPSPPAPPRPGQCPRLRGGHDRAQEEHLLSLRHWCHPPGGECCHHVQICLLRLNLCFISERDREWPAVSAPGCGPHMGGFGLQWCDDHHYVAQALLAGPQAGLGPG